MPGANDDGSGVAAMMELTKIMSKDLSLHHPFCGGNWKEQGLYGSRHLADLLKKKLEYCGNVNNDMIGNSLSSGTNLRDNTKVRVFSEATPT
jgi:Zn-dependent M28 family amino/carboxypeptidase